MLIIALIILIPHVLVAAGSSGVSGADFLEIGVGSRALGMGEAFTAATDDINLIYYNPAGLATVKYPLLSILHQELILDSRYENISACFPIYRGIAGVSNSLFWVPSFDKIDINGNKTGDVKYYNGVFTAAYGYNLGFMYVGGSIKYIYQKIDTLFVNSVAVDAGVLKGMYMYSPFDAPVQNFFLGLSLQNIGTNAKDDPLPRIIRAGMSYRLTKWFSFNTDVTENFIDISDLYDFTYGFNESFRVYSGIELTYMDILALRGGYRFNDGGTYSAGLGFNYVIGNVSFNVDTSYSENGIFGPTYSMNASFKLIPKVITIEDKIAAEDLYKSGIRAFVSNEVDRALELFEKCREYNPYHRNINEKIDDLKEIIELKKRNEELDEELKGIQ